MQLKVRIHFTMALLMALGSLQSVAAFDGERALELIRGQCALGPRVPGTAAHEAGRQWIGEQLRGLGLEVVEQPFETVLPLTGQRVRAVNIWGVPAGDGPTSPALVLSAHWDTRPFADSDPSGRNPPMLGANDGGSGVAMALELYRALGEAGPRDQVALMFFDAEDAGIERDHATWALGARRAAADPPDWIDRVALGINLDMVAGAELVLRREVYSERAAPAAVEELWRLGRQMAPARFSNQSIGPITDDHLPWIESGRAWINLIGFPYEHWHTAADGPENCSAATMQAVGEVVLRTIRRGGWRTGGG